jgi:hypothetical protein
MNRLASRRRFLWQTAATGVVCGLGDLRFLSRLPAVSAAEARLPAGAVSLRPEIAPLVRLLVATPRARLLEEVAARVRRGLEYRELLAALLLAGVRNIEPRPVGFKFHAVLVVNSAHLASLASPGPDRWLPIFWALDYFKQSQDRDAREGDWTMGPVRESAVPGAARAHRAFVEAMDDWNEEAADAAVLGLVRTAEPREIFEVLCRYGARDFRDIGHKAIYVANGWRTLQYIGWPHAEPVLRSIAYALLSHEGDNPSRRDAGPDRPGRRNATVVAKVRGDLRPGTADVAATSELLSVLRSASSEQACDAVVDQLARGLGTQPIWDGLLLGAGELLMRQPGIVSLHAVTTANALYYAFRNSGDEEARKLFLLQAAAFHTMFRGFRSEGIEIDRLEPLPIGSTGPEALAEIFADMSRDRMTAARKVLTCLRDDPRPEGLMAAARRLVFLKGTGSHDYKFSSAVLEDGYQVSDVWRARYLAASAFNLTGSGGPDNQLVERTRDAFRGA